MGKLYTTKRMSLSSLQFSETFLLTTRSLLAWLSTTLFAVFRDLSGDDAFSAYLVDYHAVQDLVILACLLNQCHTTRRGFGALGSSSFVGIFFCNCGTLNFAICMQ